MNEINISVRDKISLKDAVKIAQRFCPEFDKKLIEYEVNETYEGLLETEDKLLKFGMDTSDIPITTPRKTRLFLNLRTADHLGLTIPDEVIKGAEEIF